MTMPALQFEFTRTTQENDLCANENRTDRWRQITQQMSLGDLDAFEEFYQSFFDLMFGHAKAITSFDESTCLDVVQDAMLKAMKSMRAFDQKAKLESWCCAVVKSVVYDRLRQEIARENRQRVFAKRHRESDQNAADQNQIENSARLIWIESQLHLLDPALRKMFRLRYRLGWSLKKIAENFGLKTGAVDGRIRRALQKIREHAQEDFDE